VDWNKRVSEFCASDEHLLFRYGEYMIYVEVVGKAPDPKG